MAQQAYDAAREIALRQLTAADRTEAELRERLITRGVDPQVADAVVTRFVEVGLVDDDAFAHTWVASRRNGRGLSRRAIDRELATKGVDAALRDRALQDVDGPAERATAERLVRRRLASLGGVDPGARFRRLAGMLARKGYDADLVFDVVRAVLDETGSEEQHRAPAPGAGAPHPGPARTDPGRGGLR